MRQFTRTMLLLPTLALASLTAGPAQGIYADPEYDFWHKMEAQGYDSVVKQFGFDTSLDWEWDKDNNVVKTFQVTFQTTASSYSTATLVDSQYVLTAGHTVLPHGMLQYEIGGELYTGTRWWVPNGYGENDWIVNNFDIALVKLDRPVHNVTPLQINNSISFNSLKNQKFKMLGYGASSTGDEGTFYGDGVLRAAYNKFDVEPRTGIIGENFSLLYDLDVDFNDLVFGPDENYSFDTDYPVVLEGSILPGDSGGPDLIGNKVVGVHSGYYFDFTDPNSFGLYGISTNVAAFAGWLESIMIEDVSQMPAWGWDSGMLGITIQDIRDDLEEDEPTLTPWLINQGYLDMGTGHGTDIFSAPIFSGWLDPNTGMPQIDPFFNASAPVDLTDPTVKAEWDASIAWARDTFASGLTVEDQFWLLFSHLAEQSSEQDPLKGLSHPAFDAILGQNGGGISGWTLGPTDAGVILGDFNLDGQLSNADIEAMVVALVDLPTYYGDSGLTFAQLMALGDINGDDRITNADVEALLGLLTTSTSSGPTVVVPEPASLAMLGLGAAAMLRRRRR